MASQRAAEMARIMMEEWPDDESCESFVLRRFYSDTYVDLEAACQIFTEIEKADSAADDVIRKRQL